MSSLSTHVLDTAVGRPAEGVRVTLERGGTPLGSGITDTDGRIREFAGADADLSPGEYTLRFAVAEYFAATERDSFYPEIVVSFRVADSSGHYHVPLLLSPFGYSTYRGS